MRGRASPSSSPRPDRKSRRLCGMSGPPARAKCGTVRYYPNSRGGLCSSASPGRLVRKAKPPDGAALMGRLCRVSNTPASSSPIVLAHVWRGDHPAPGSGRLVIEHVFELDVLSCEAVQGLSQVLDPDDVHRPLLPGWRDDHRVEQIAGLVRRAFQALVPRSWSSGSRHCPRSRRTAPLPPRVSGRSP